MDKKKIEDVETLIATLVLAREKAEDLEGVQIADWLSKNIARLRREVKKATKPETTKAASK